MSQFLSDNRVEFLYSHVLTFIMWWYRYSLTWEVFEWQVRIVEVTSAADNGIKNVVLLVSISSLSHHIPLTSARKVRSLFHTFDFGLRYNKYNSRSVYTYKY